MAEGCWCLVADFHTALFADRAAVGAHGGCVAEFVVGVLTVFGAEVGAQTGAGGADGVDDVTAGVEGLEEGFEGGDARGHECVLEAGFGDDGGEDAGEGWVGVANWSEVVEADDDEGNQSAMYESGFEGICCREQYTRRQPKAPRTRMRF